MTPSAPPICFASVCNQFQGVFDASRRRLAAMGPLEIEPSPTGDAGDLEARSA